MKKALDFLFRLLFPHRNTRLKHLEQTVEAQRRRIKDLEETTAELQWAADHTAQFKEGQEILLPVEETNEAEMWAIRERKPCLSLGRFAINGLTNFIAGTDRDYFHPELYYWRYKLEYMKPSGTVVIPTGVVKFKSQDEIIRLQNRVRNVLARVR